jgi:hypothetical protein
MLRDSLAFHTVAGRLRDAVVVRLDSPAATGVTGVPSRACVVPGQVAWDDCDCEGGLLAVAVARTFYSETFPVEASGFDARAGTRSPCELPYLVAELVVQVVRCAPGPDGRGNPPSCEALAASARQAISDAAEARTAVVCGLGAMQDANDIADYLVQAQTFQGPEGGCVGSELKVLVSLVNACQGCG